MPMPVNPHRLRKLLQKLVDIYSPSGKEEDILDFVKGYLKRRGMPFDVQAVDDNRYNLIIAPPEREIRLAFIGHLDTVPAPDFDNYAFKETGDQIKGLGVADMKGGCAAMLEAYQSLWESGRNQPPLAVCLVVGEEETGDGADELMKSYHFPWAIIAEPTNLRPCFQTYGYVEIQITTRGRRLHASLAKRNRNAIEVMLQHVLRLTQYLETRHPELTYNIRDLSSNPAGFAVPERCETWLDIHMPPAAPIGEILTALEEIVLNEITPSTGVETAYRTVTIDAGYELPEKGPVFETLSSVFERHRLPWRPQPFKSHSDANQIWAAGVKPIILGPGELEQAHTEHECASLQQICLAAQLYLDFMQLFFQVPGQPTDTI
jgi:acetylornithine deacetylase